MKPICVEIFDVNRLIPVATHFIDMCLTSGADGPTAEGICAATDEVFAKNQMPWENSVSLSVDNTNSVIGKNNSIASRFLERNENVFIAVCLCYLAYIAASDSHDAFIQYNGLNVDNVMVDLFYSFDKSAKRK